MVESLDVESVLLISMPYADISIPSIQLSLLESYLKNKNIPTSSLHLYLFAAESYGLKNYSYLITSPNDPYVSQMIFTKHVFPNHWEKNKEKIKKYYTNNVISANPSEEQLTFEEYEERTDSFLINLFEGIQWDAFDIIGFSLNYGQFLPSLAVAKKIKQHHPNKKIVLGGSTVMDELGLNIINQFDYIDFIVNGEGERTLEALAKNKNSKIPGLITKNKNGIHQKQQYTCENCVNLNELPFLDFSSYYQQLSMSSNEIQQYAQLNNRIPIELSRGCWWNNCSFCNQSAYHAKYREKDIDRFIDELDYLSHKYNTLSFQIIGSVLPPKNLRKLCEKIISLEKDFDFIAEARADHLLQEDYFYLKKAGFNTIQTGIESFSKNYLLKMNKGTRIIDNIAALKYSKQYHIKNEYNIIINFPNEEPKDFSESMETISLFNQYLDPPRISPFIVSYKSPIYKKLDEFNIKRLVPKNIDCLMFPNDFLKKQSLYFYDFERKKEITFQKWDKLVDNWKKTRQEQQIKSIKSGQIIDDLSFYYVDGKTFIKIFDKRNLQDVQIFILDPNERAVFLFCSEIITFDELTQNISWLSEQEITQIVSDLVENKIIYGENNSFLALPICLQTYMGLNISPKIENEQQLALFQ